ncbi:MAG: ankyrin repeat domain-containing protein [Oligoflexia bacterium]|nr:ankyrin repeat domain-containing protein [Oligoflexia bacterium]
MTDQATTQQLFQFCEGGNYSELCSLITKNISLDLYNAHKNTPLIVSIIKKQQPIIELLIGCGCDVNLQDAKDRTPLMFAASLGMVDVIKLILFNGGNINASDEQGRSALIYAIKTQEVAAVSTLLALNASVNSVDCDGWTPLFHAVSSGNLEIVNLLIKANAKIDFANKKKKTALLLAIEKKQTAVVQALLAAGANKNIVDQSARSPLLEAVALELYEVIPNLITAENINLADVNGNTPLMIAATLGNADLIDLFISSDAHVDLQNRDGQTPLMLSTDIKSIIDNQNNAIVKTIKGVLKARDHDKLSKSKGKKKKRNLDTSSEKLDADIHKVRAFAGGDVTEAVSLLSGNGPDASAAETTVIDTATDRVADDVTKVSGYGDGENLDDHLKVTNLDPNANILSDENTLVKGRGEANLEEDLLHVKSGESSDTTDKEVTKVAGYSDGTIENDVMRASALHTENTPDEKAVQRVQGFSDGKIADDHIRVSSTENSDKQSKDATASTTTITSKLSFKEKIQKAAEQAKLSSTALLRELMKVNSIAHGTIKADEHTLVSSLDAAKKAGEKNYTLVQGFASGALDDDNILVSILGEEINHEAEDEESSVTENTLQLIDLELEKLYDTMVSTLIQGKIETPEQYQNVSLSLLKAGSDPTLSDKRNQSAISTLLQSEHPEIIRLLNDRKSNYKNPDSINSDPHLIRSTLLTPDTSQQQLYQEAILTLENNSEAEGAEVPSNQSPLLQPKSPEENAEKAAEKAAEKLRQKLATTKFANGQTPLMVSASKGQMSVVEKIISMVDVNAKDFSGYTALTHAAIGGHLEMVQFLIQHGARVEEKNVKVITPLAWAVMKTHSDVAKALIQAGANVNVKINGIPIIFIAIEREDTSLIATILEKDLNFHNTDRKSRTVIAVAKAKGNPEIIKMIEQKRSASKS